MQTLSHILDDIPWRVVHN